MRSRRTLVAAALLLLGAAAWIARLAPSAAPAEHEAGRTVERDDADRVVERAAEPGAGEAEPPPELAPTTLAEAEAGEPAAAGSVRRTPAAVDPCAEAEDDEAIERPQLGTLLSDRVLELNDRMHAAMRRTAASEELREGLRLGTDPATGDRSLALLARAPDRIEDGFDLRVAVLVVLASQALGAGDLRRARTLAATAAREAPDDPLPLALEARADEGAGDDAAAEDALRRAHALDPSEPAIALALARHLRDGPSPAEAVAVLDAYLREVPEDAAQRRLRERLARREAATRGHRSVRRGAVTLLGPSSADPDVLGSAAETVDAALVRSARLLGVERVSALTVVAYASREAMREATCGQSWTGAMYDGSLHVAADGLGTELGRVELAHESLHAALHGALPTVRVPTWLDEGLAQYVSGERELDAGIARSFRLMAEENAIIPFESMDGAFLVIDDPTDARLAYHQALAMVLWLVDRRGERGVAAAIDWLEGGGDAARVLEEAARAALTREGLREFLRTELR